MRKSKRGHREIFSQKSSSKPLWDLYRDGLTVTGIRLFRTCREQFRLKYPEGYSSKHVVGPLDFGSATHAALEAIRNRWAAEWNPKKGESWCSKVVQVATNRYKQERMEEGIPQHESDKLDLLICQVQVIVCAYFKFWQKQDSKFRWYGQELEFRFQSDATLNIPFVGKIDGVIDSSQRVKVGKKDFSAKQKLYRIFETKTKTQIDEEGISGYIPLDTQTMVYALAVRECLGIEPIGTCYDVILRPGLKLLQGSSKRRPETLKQHAERLGEVIDKNPKRWFHRWNVDFAPGDLDRFVNRQLKPQVRSLNEWNEIQRLIYRDRYEGVTVKDNPVHYLNEDALYGYGRRSEFFDAITRNNFKGLFRRKLAHPELSGKPTLTNIKD